MQKGEFTTTESVMNEDWLYLKVQSTDPIHRVIYIQIPRDMRFYNRFKNTGRNIIHKVSTWL